MGRLHQGIQQEVDTRIDGCALSANGSHSSPFILAVKYDGNVSPDIRWRGGIVLQCNSECTFPCWQFDVDRGEVDIITDQFELFDSLTVDGMRDKVQDYVNSRIKQVCLDCGVPRNCPNCTSPSGPDFISEAVLGVVGVVMYISGWGTASVLLLTVLVAYLIMNHCHFKTMKSTVNSESGDSRKLGREHGILLNCLKEVSLVFVPDVRWTCLCRTPCNLAPPCIALYNRVGYAFFLFEEERELEECIGAKFSELKKTYHVSDIFGVQLDDLEGVLSVEDLYLRHRVSEEWQRSPSKEVVFLPFSESPTTPNVGSNSITIPIVDSNNEVTGINLNKIGELSTVLSEAPVREELVEPKQHESTSKGSPVLNGCSWLGSRSVEPRTSTQREDYQLEVLSSQNGEVITDKPRSTSFNAQTTVDPTVEDHDEVTDLPGQPPSS